MTQHLTQQQRDARDLEALRRTDAGESVSSVSRSLGFSRGVFLRLRADIRADEAQQ